MSEIRVQSLAHTNGTNAINLDGGGRATFPKAKVPSFHVYRTTTNSVADATFYTIPFDANEFIHDWSLNTSTGVLTCGTDASGIYLLTAQCRLETGSDFNARCQIRLNGTNIMTSYMRQEYYDKFHIHSLIEISAADELSVVFRQDSGGSVNVGTTDGGNNNTFLGYRISK
tara:strand:- start:1228 stop:1740 length:513 start_codon:yes stop_codon:yes gene_type:complete